jgi:hemerythrin
MIQWDAKYEIGIKTIDDQHKELLRIIGNLSDLLTNAQNGDDIYDEMVSIISALTTYTVYHFKYEEDLFYKFNYALTDIHIEEHVKLVDQIKELDLKNLDEDAIDFGKKILKFLISWLFKHISGSDFLYRDLFIENNVK